MLCVRENFFIFVRFLQKLTIDMLKESLNIYFLSKRIDYTLIHFTFFLQDQYANLNSLFEYTRSLDSVEVASGSAFSELAIRSQFLIVLEYPCQSFYGTNLDYTYNMAIDDYASGITSDILKACKNGCTKRENNGANSSFTRQELQQRL